MKVAAKMKLIEKLRRRALLTQKELGVQIGYSGAYISGCELGWHRPSERFQQACERFFSIPAKELFSEVNEPTLKHLHTTKKNGKDRGKERTKATKRRKR